MRFEYDEAKARTNAAKHGVSFEEAKLAFADPNRKIYLDKLHSDTELRQFCIGKVGGSVMTVVFTLRNGNIRIISAGYYRKGRKLYEQR